MDKSRPRTQLPVARQNVNLAPRKGAFLEIDGNTLGLDDGERVEVMASLSWNHEVVSPRDAFGSASPS